jgi:hypothetical protein
MMVMIKYIWVIFEDIFIVEPAAPVSKWNGGGNSGASNGFKSFNNNNNDENSNPNNNGGGFGSRSGDGFSGNYSQFDLYHRTILFSF